MAQTRSATRKKQASSSSASGIKSSSADPKQRRSSTKSPGAKAKRAPGQTALTQYMQRRLPPPKVRRIPFLDLPNEIKMMIYNAVWEEFGGDNRSMHVKDDKSWWGEDDPFERCDIQGNPYGPSQPLWALARTCREIYTMVIPLLYKGVTFRTDYDEAVDDYHTSPEDLAAFLQTCRIDLIGRMSLACDVSDGFAKLFVRYMEAISYGRHLDHLEISFDIECDAGVDYSNNSAELALVRMYWQRFCVRSRIAIEVSCCGRLTCEQYIRKKLTGGCATLQLRYSESTDNPAAEEDARMRRNTNDGPFRGSTMDIGRSIEAWMDTDSSSDSE
ncbi:hypothetical protein K461DRAFT_176190 [Myriangium duriaei CBS 260.36]|uniref:DUF7730 domain-containing protein n=1 Tax=Myriangium duriaei CBS 260.36 TaxID=1168546 RepID=A0A9P4IZ05_9PEZI|nr:hypothetical protein K461DRAFT_176190 [Myriangium duriaei CBS 260.36]